MQTAIVIPARLGSTRLARKALADIAGTPMVVRVAQQALRCRCASVVVVATDSDEIAITARAHGIRAVVTGDHSSGTDRVAEAARQIEADFIINLQGDEPFVDPSDLDIVAQALSTVQSDIVTLKTPIHEAELHDPNVCKVVTKDDQTAMYFSRAAIPFERSGVASTEQVYKHIGIYGFKRQALKQMSQAPMHFLERKEGLEQLRALAMGMSILVLDGKSTGRGIDTADDLAWALERIQQLGDKAFP
jgi:3-deoxy-manno-octulosonate cytidylyltransferase (CMP-KDO synthetase)